MVNIICIGSQSGDKRRQRKSVALRTAQPHGAGEKVVPYALGGVAGNLCRYTVRRYIANYRDGGAKYHGTAPKKYSGFAAPRNHIVDYV